LKYLAKRLLKGFRYGQPPGAGEDGAAAVGQIRLELWNTS
jgi:hypothetical protein